MPTIYTGLLHALLAPLAGLADDDEETDKYSHVDRDDPRQIKPIIKEILLPAYLQRDQQEREATKLCLRYYLSKPGSRFGRLYDSMLLPFDHPSDPRTFFVWLWEIFFAEEEYQLSDLDQYTVDNRLDVTYEFPPTDI